MGFSVEQKNRLRDRLDQSAVKTRSQAGQTLHYVEGHWVISQLNEIFGPDGWTSEILSIVKTVDENYTTARGDENRRVGYMATVRITAGDTFREDAGHGNGTGKDATMAHEGAVKEAITDAIKRCSRLFGNALGGALYDKSHDGVGTPDYALTEAAAAATTTISAAQVAELRTLIAATKTELPKLLAFAGATSLETLTLAALPKVKAVLAQKMGASK